MNSSKRDYIDLINSQSSSVNKKMDVLVIWPNQPLQMELLAKKYNLHRYDLADDVGKLAMLERVSHKIRAVITTHGGGFSQDLLAQLPCLEIVVCSSVGLDTLCVDRCLARNVAVTNTPDVLTDDVADMALMLILACVRRLPLGSRWISNGHWQNQGQAPLNHSIRNKHLGIVGLGRIGKAIAKRAQAFGMKISYYGRTEKKHSEYKYYDNLITLAQDVDILLPAIPGGKETEQLISREVLSALNSGSYFINISRGSVVDEQALVELLSANALAGAGLDVFVDEPNVPAALLDMENVVLQPHCASGTHETRGAMAQLVVDNLAAHFAGRALLTPVK